MTPSQPREYLPPKSFAGCPEVSVVQLLLLFLLLFSARPSVPAQSADDVNKHVIVNKQTADSALYSFSFKELAQNGRTHLSSASIMSGSSSMHGGSGSSVTVSGQGLNGVKLEGQYYCNSYTPPTAVDHGLLPPSYSKLFLCTTIYHKYLEKIKIKAKTVLKINIVVCNCNPLMIRVWYIKDVDECC